MFGPLTLLYNVLATYPGLLDAIKLALLGLILDRARRVLQGFWKAASRALTLTARISDSDDCYDWLRQYLSAHCMDLRSPHSGSSWIQGDSISQILLEEVWPTGRVPPRDIQLSVIKRNRHPWAWDGGEFKEDATGKVDVHMAPSVGTPHYLRFRGYTVCFVLDETAEEFGQKRNWVIMSAMFAPHSLFDELVSVAQKEFLFQDHGKLRIFTPRSDGRPGWKKTTTKPHRPWNTVILPGSVMDDVLKDAREFLAEQAFYRKRGLPYRRGYLLHGTPGAGKSSLIAALAAELRLDIYIVNLSSKSLDDNGLSKLMHDVPSRAILLMEDIDCALDDRKAKEAPEEEPEEKKTRLPGQDKRRGGVTLSGLLNALDGVASSEGRLLFCTTNHVDQIDAALSRPGRCDIWVEFAHATKVQILEVFVHFYQPEAANLLGGDSLNGITEKGEKLEQESSPDTLAPSPNIDDDQACLSAPSSAKLATMLQGLGDADTTNVIGLAKRFAAIIPDGVVSVSAIQGYLMRHKRRPEDAVDGAKKWVEDGFPQGPGAKSKGDEMEKEEKGGKVDTNPTEKED